VNPACDDEERAYQRHEMDVIAAFVQDAFRLPNPEEIVPGCDGCEEKRNKMIIAFPMMFQDDWQKRDGNQERRKRQEEYNKEHGITPKTVKRALTLLAMAEGAIGDTEEPSGKKKKAALVPQELTIEGIRKKIADWDKAMRKAAKDLRFEDAAHARDMMHKYQEMELTFG